jgi:hypothetical protein
MLPPMPWGAEGRRRRRAQRPFNHPAGVIHALDYFIWAALDEVREPTYESRPFSDDERHYNGILNRYYGIDIPSNAEASMPGIPPGPGPFRTTSPMGKSTRLARLPRISRSFNISTIGSAG